MRTLERGAVYDSKDNTVGFRCSKCGKIFNTMLGDVCDLCREAERKEKTSG